MNPAEIVDPTTLEVETVIRRPAPIRRDGARGKGRDRNHGGCSLDPQIVRHDAPVPAERCWPPRPRLWSEAAGDPDRRHNQRWREQARCEPTATEGCVPVRHNGLPITG